MNTLDSLYIDWIKRMYSSINIKIECKEHQQGLDPKLHRQSIFWIVPFMLSQEWVKGRPGCSERVSLSYALSQQGDP